MSYRDRRGMRVTLGALSAAGVVGTHLVAYALGESSMDATGNQIATTHSHWNYVIALAVAALIGSMAMVISARRDGRTNLTPKQLALRSFPRLALLHLSGFVFLEITEVTLTGGDTHHLLSQGPVLIGCFVAIAMAGLASILLGILAATVDLVLRERLSSGSPAGPVLPIGGEPRSARKLNVDRLAWGSRGPPVRKERPGLPALTAG